MPPPTRCHSPNGRRAGHRRFGEPASSDHGRARRRRAGNARQSRSLWKGAVIERWESATISGLVFWGECEAQQGMSFRGRGMVSFRAGRPRAGLALPAHRRCRGASSSTPISIARRRRSSLPHRDHIQLCTSAACACGRTCARASPRHRAARDDILSSSSRHFFPTLRCVRIVNCSVCPRVSGFISVRPRSEVFGGSRR